MHMYIDVTKSVAITCDYIVSFFFVNILSANLKSKKMTDKGNNKKLSKYCPWRFLVRIVIFVAFHFS